MIPIYCPEMRYLIMKQPKVVSRYLSKAKELCEEHKINQKIFYLGNIWFEFSYEEKEDKLNKIDRQVTNLLLNAEQKYCHLCARAVSFSA